MLLSVNRLLNNLHVLHSWSKHSVCNTCHDENYIDVSIFLRSKSIRKGGDIDNWAIRFHHVLISGWHLHKCTYSWPVYVYCKIDPEFSRDQSKWNCQRFLMSEKKGSWHGFGQLWQLKDTLLCSYCATKSALKKSQKIIILIIGSGRFYYCLLLEIFLFNWSTIDF